MVSRFLGRFRRSGSGSRSRASKGSDLGELAPLVERSVLGAVLARGADNQVEGDQILTPVGGIPMAQRVVFTLSTVGDVLGVGRPGTLAGVASVPYYRKDRNTALTGLVTGMQAAQDLSPPGVKPLVVLVGVDQPYLRVETLRFLLAFAGGDEAVIPVDEAGRQPTCAVFPSTWLDKAREADHAGQTLEEFLAGRPVREIGPDRWTSWGEDGRSWFHVVDGASLAEGEDRFGS